MIELQPAMKAFKESETHRLCSLWTITRTDATVLRYTDAQQPVDYESNTYNPVALVESSARDANEGLKERNKTFLGYLSSNDITEDDLRAGLYNQATVSEVIVDWKYPWQGAFQTNFYYITEIKWTGEQWEAELDGLTSRLRQRKGMTVTRRCRFELGDSSCGVDVASHTDTGSVSAIDTQRRQIQTSLTSKPNSYYNLGLLTFTSGNNNGKSFRVLDFTQVNGVVVFLEKTTYDVAVSDTFNIYPGCDHTENHCKGNDNRPWSSNFANFGGFPHVPGATAALLTPDTK